MGEKNKFYRIRTDIGQDKVLKVNLEQDYDFLEILSLKINQKNAYKTHTSNYGVIVGRVLANGGFGIPNAKLSVFIQVSDIDINNPIISSLYPYNNTRSTNNDGIRYNLLPDYKVNDCHKVIGTFPNKRLVLDDDNVLEVYDTYYKFTTRTNESGDYMIFGVPVGNQTIHVDLDLSDIGILSQRPRDFIYKGYNITQFENPNQFKSETNIDSLTQIYSQDSMVYVYPFWGDDNEDTIAISRNDVQIQFKFEPTCVFMGSVITDGSSDGIGKKCISTEKAGAMDELVSGSGSIEIIRKKSDNTTEELQIQGTQLINGNGVWCFQIPMNLDYMTTDEYGNMVPTDDPDKGIPTRTRVRFRVSLNDFQNDYNNFKRGKLLIPNNPKKEEDIDYSFGTSTNDENYRDLFWNNVYTVKSYIPRIQKGNNNSNKKFTGIKHCNIFGSNNPIPYNNIRIQMPLQFSILCAIIKAFIFLVRIVNILICGVPGLGFLPKKRKRTCIYLPEGLCEQLEGWYYAPGCNWGSQLTNTLNDIKSKEGSDPNSIDYQNSPEGDETYCVTKNTDFLMQCVEIELAQEYKVINFDFYNDWLNGVVYIPQWMRNIRKKQSYFFGLINIKPKIQACTENSFFNTRSLVQQCALTYGVNDNGTITDVKSDLGCVSNSRQKCHKGKGRKRILIFGGNGGVVREEKTLQGQSVYYYKPCEWHSGKKVNLFATDIVLLGSLNDCDLNGIPKAFELLTSSTYQMPTNLALTNMDSNGYMYGLRSTSTVCDGVAPNDIGATKIDDTFDDYKKHIIGASFLSEQYDGLWEDDSTPITEMSGIDWGYSGPGQGESDLSTLYFPGGHFLGISCTNSQTNIKSCVNLTRVCEIGAWMSQRQELPNKYANGEISYLILTPNGYIAKDELSDNDFRAMFATMNHNGLKTIYDPTTGYLKYDLKYFYPINFNGELSKILNNGLYQPYNAINVGGENNAIRRVIETQNKQYYMFRFGLNDDLEGQESKFLIQDGNLFSLPVYENSYYFFFGLKSGSTALDEFYKQYYSVCDKENVPPFGITYAVNDVELCGSLGSCNITLQTISLPCSFELLYNGINIVDYSVDHINGIGSSFPGWAIDGQIFVKDGIIYKYENGKWNSTNEIFHFDENFGYNKCGTCHKWNCNTINLTNLEAGEYTLNVYDINGNMNSIDFQIKNNNISCDIFSDNFKTDMSTLVSFDDNYEKYYNDIININSKNDNGGYIRMNNIFNLPEGNSFSENVIIFICNIKNNNVKYFICSSQTDIDLIKKSIQSYDNIELSNNLIQLNYTDKSIDPTNSKQIVLWDGNCTYKVYLLYKCNNNYNVFIKREFYVEAPQKLSLIINNAIDYDYIKKFNTGYNSTLIGWNNLCDYDSYVFKDETSDIEKEGIVYLAKKAFYYDGINSAAISFIPKNGTPIYSSRLLYQPEDEVIDNDSNKIELSNDILNEENSGFITVNIPTLYVNANNDSIEYVYRTATNNKDKRLPFYGWVKDANWQYSDQNNINYIIPSISESYSEINGVSENEIKEISNKWFGVHILNRPFYFNAIIWLPNDKVIDLSDNSKPLANGKLIGEVHNGITVKNGDKYYYDECLIVTNNGNTSIKNSFDLSDDETLKRELEIEGDSKIMNSNSYTLSITEASDPVKHDVYFKPNTISASLSINFYDLDVSRNGTYVTITATNLTSQNVSYFLINGYYDNNNKYPYPFDTIKNYGIFSLNITSDSISNNNGNSILLDFTKSKTITINTSFNIFYIIGIPSILQTTNTNTLNICKMYGVWTN